MEDGRLADLNISQMRAVANTEGPLLIIAGPGSGKTYTLVERVFYLIDGQGVAPENILVSTFTEKAAMELVTRISNRVAEHGGSFNLTEMYIGTLHSICLRILEENREFTRLKKNFSIMDQFDQQYFLYQRINEYLNIPNNELILGNQKTSRWRRSENLMKWLNKVNEELVDVKALLSSLNPQVVALGKCMEVYHQQLEEENTLDFSSIQSEAYRLLSQQPDVLKKMQERIHYLMVDEYQDTNTVQEAIIFLLAGERKNICVVGDDDQGLYRFRGATIRNILEFPDHFAKGECQIIKLETNYRSHPEIIEFFGGWMEMNDWQHGGITFRYEKQLKPRDATFPKTKTVVKVAGQQSLMNWEEEVYQFLMVLKKKGDLKDWNQVAFLFRSVKNERVLRLARFLEGQGIPVYSPRSNLFFEREEVRLVIGALVFLFPQFPDVRKWSEDAHLEEWEYFDSCFRQFAERLREPVNDSLLRWARIRAKEHLTLSANTDYGFTGLFYQLLQFPLFMQFLDSSDLSGVHDSRAVRNLAIFSQLLMKFEYLHNILVLTPKYLETNIRNLFNQFLRFLMDGGLDEYEDMIEYAPSGCVSFLTVHQAKGLEFPVVIVGSLEAGPRKAYTELDEVLQAEFYSKRPFEPLGKIKYYDFWRLYYTAFSRAQNLLVLTCEENQGHGRKVPSEYFKELYEGVPSWRGDEFDLSALHFEKVKDVNLKQEYSFTSHILLFENCARQYKFFKELEFAPVRQGATLFGTVVHQTIEDVHKAVLRGEAHLVTEKQIETWFNINYRYLVKKERTFLDPARKDIALRQVLSYVERESGNWDILKEAEVEVALVKESYILKGTIDLIRGDNNTIEIVDFKAEKKPDLFSEREKIEQYRRQLEVYSHIIEERTGLKVTKSHIYYTGEKSGNPYVSFKKDDGSIEGTIAQFSDIVGRIEHKDFEIKERPMKLCKECDMRFYCDSK